MKYLLLILSFSSFITSMSLLAMKTNEIGLGLKRNYDLATKNGREFALRDASVSALAGLLKQIGQYITQEQLAGEEGASLLQAAVNPAQDNVEDPAGNFVLKLQYLINAGVGVFSPGWSDVIVRRLITHDQVSQNSYFNCRNQILKNDKLPDYSKAFQARLLTRGFVQSALKLIDNEKRKLSQLINNNALQSPSGRDYAIRYVLINDMPLLLDEIKKYVEKDQLQGSEGYKLLYAAADPRNEDWETNPTDNFVAKLQYLIDAGVGISYPLWSKEILKMLMREMPLNVKDLEKNMPLHEKPLKLALLQKAYIDQAVNLIHDQVSSAHSFRRS